MSMYVPDGIIGSIFSVSALIRFLHNIYILSLLKLRFVSLKQKQRFKKRVVRTKFDIHVFISTNCGYPVVFLIPDMGCQVETAHGFQ